MDINEAELLVTNAGSVPSYITVEHLKIPQDNIEVRELFLDEYANTKFYKSPNNMRNIEMYPTIKIENIERLKAIANANGVKIGVGDNDLHHLSQSRCCCGIDTINENFDNYLKYNLTYFITGDDDSEDFSGLYIPKGNCRECFNSHVDKGDKFLAFDKKVKDYVNAFEELIPKEKKSNIEKQLFGISKKKLF